MESNNTTPDCNNYFCGYCDTCKSLNDDQWTQAIIEDAALPPPQKIKMGRPKTILIDKKTYQKLYYETNKVLLKSKYGGEMVCDVCNIIHSKANKSRHYKSKIHNQNLLKVSL